jgi:hypothetical protein
MWGAEVSTAGFRESGESSWSAGTTLLARVASRYSMTNVQRITARVNSAS